ncbi:acetyl-CoA carboxylase biotin carboxyl carrier protein [Achromobacter sp. F4_2707]|uniref:acetyl-CoA carboxylase biotin carboxyl carrier protein n=1 Tax=Achromobacter sp. F4_2707 TaxID=3114286 RepID=UPI0039C6F748
MSKVVELHEVKSLVDWLNLSDDVQEFSLKYGELEIFVSRKEGGPSASAPALAPVAAPAPAPAAAAAAAPAVSAPVSSESPVAKSGPAVAGKIEAAADEVLIKAPMVGTFYAAPKPGAPAFVKEGDVVNPQSVLCIVEVMKLMNNIEAGVHGTVEKIFVENEQAVEYGQPLMLIKLSQ